MAGINLGSNQNVVKTADEIEFDEMLKQAQKEYPDTPVFLLRVALQTALREEELQKNKKFPKKKHLIEKEEDVEKEWVREVPENLEYNGITIIPPTETVVVEEKKD